MQIDPKGLEAAIEAAHDAWTNGCEHEADDLGLRHAVPAAIRAYLSALSPAAPMLVDMGSGRRWMTPAPSPALPPKTEGWASHLVEEGSTQSDEYTELALALTAAEARASSAEAQLAEMREALRPFAEAAAGYDPDEGEDRDVAWAHDFTIGSLRRARRVLSKGVRE